MFWTAIIVEHQANKSSLDEWQVSSRVVSTWRVGFASSQSQEMLLEAIQNLLEIDAQFGQLYKGLFHLVYQSHAKILRNNQAIKSKV